MIVLIWIVASLFVGAFANSRGRSGWGWGFISLLLSPVLALILLLILSPGQQHAVMYVPQNQGLAQNASLDPNTAYVPINVVMQHSQKPRYPWRTCTRVAVAILFLCVLVYAVTRPIGSQKSSGDPPRLPATKATIAWGAPAPLDTYSQAQLNVIGALYKGKMDGIKNFEIYCGKPVDVYVRSAGQWDGATTLDYYSDKKRVISVDINGTHYDGIAVIIARRADLPEWQGDLYEEGMRDSSKYALQAYLTSSSSINEVPLDPGRAVVMLDCHV